MTHVFFIFRIGIVSTRRMDEWENKTSEWTAWEPWAFQLLFLTNMRPQGGSRCFPIIHLEINLFKISPIVLLNSTHQLRMWDPRLPGRKHQSCSRPACGPDPVRRDTNAGTAFPQQMHEHAPWTDHPAERRGTTEWEAWGGSAAWRDNLLHGCLNSSALQRLLGLKLLLAQPEGKQNGGKKKHRWWAEN